MMTAENIHTENPARENLVYMWPIEVSGQIVSDQTSRFPRVSSRDNRSVMAFHEYDSNIILNESFKNHTTQYLVRAQTRLIQYLLDRGLKPSALRIDNN